MCHPAAYAAVFIAQAYMSAQAQNEQAQKQMKCINVMLNLENVNIKIRSYV